MSEPLGVEERARLRDDAGWQHIRKSAVMAPTAIIVEALCDYAESHVDRLTEALEATERHKAEAVRDLLNARRAIADEWYPRAERAEADLADEKRRRAELRALADQYGCACLLDGRPCWGCRLRALLATTERCTCDPGPEGQHQLDRCEGFGQPTALLDTATEETP